MFQGSTLIPASFLSALLFHDTNGQTLHEQSQTAIGGTFQSLDLLNIQKCVFQMPTKGRESVTALCQNVAPAAIRVWSVY
jgi:hypothetical protein